MIKPNKRTEDLNIEPKHMTLFPTMETLQSCVDLGISQLPFIDKNAVVGLLMIYHNSLLKQIADEKNKNS